MRDRIHTGIVVGVLLLVGALLGSVLLEWGNGREGASGSTGVPLTVESPAGSSRVRVSLEVLNGSTGQGAAERMANRLRDMGFDVKTFGNARSNDYAETVLLDRSERPGATATIADSLGGVPIRVDPDPQLYLDATLVLGADWREVLARVGR